MAKLSRKGRKGSRKATRNNTRRMGMRRLRGGAQLVVPAGVSDNSMMAASKLNLAQGNDYASLHVGQHGGMAPVGHTGMLDDSLRAIARVGVLDQSMTAASGMSDQSGGRRRKGSRKGGRKGRRGSRKGRRAPKISHQQIMRMLVRLNKKSRRMRGGSAAPSLTHAQDYSAPGMLLSPGAERIAVNGMNPEWKLATDVSAFSPTMYR